MKIVLFFACATLLAGCGANGGSDEINIETFPESVPYDGEDSCVSIAEQLGCSEGGSMIRCNQPFIFTGDPDEDDLWTLGDTCPGGNDEWRVMNLMLCTNPEDPCDQSTHPVTVPYNGEDSCVSIAEQLGCPVGGVMSNCQSPILPTGDPGQDDLWTLGQTCPGGNRQWRLINSTDCTNPEGVCNE
jgi:hypothetical protein